MIRGHFLLCLYHREAHSMIGANVGSTAVKASSDFLKPIYASCHVQTALHEEFGAMQ